MSSPHDTIESKNKKIRNLRILVAVLITAFIAIVWYANGLRVDNIKKNKEVRELQCYKQAWNDFNKSYMPETALPRIPAIEAIYKEMK